MSKLTHVLAVASLFAVASQAEAVSTAVKTACRADYYAHCSGIVVGSQELRSCMRANSMKLSKRCLQALVENREVTQADIDSYTRRSKK
jgi:hypothetical protein